MAMVQAITMRVSVGSSEKKQDFVLEKKKIIIHPTNYVFCCLLI